MCGRYVAPDVAALERFWNAKFPGNAAFESMREKLSAAFPKKNYNTVKTQVVPVLILGKDGPEIVPMRWGVDHLDKDNKRITPHNIRKDSLRRFDPWVKPWNDDQRAIQLIEGYYEWRVGKEGKKVPY